MKRLIKSFKYALNGIRISIKTEPNLRFHFISTIIVIICGFVCSLSYIEWMIVLLCIGWIVSLELINTSIEKLCDKVTSDIDETIKIVKDISAAAVLWSSIVVSIIGLIIFVPKVGRMFFLI